MSVLWPHYVVHIKAILDIRVLNQFDNVITMPYMQWINIGPPSGDAFDSSSMACRNLQNSDVELGTMLSLSHPVNCKWGITRGDVV